MALFLGMFGGSQILRYGVGLTQIVTPFGSGTPYFAAFETWDFLPAQEVGDVVYRSLSLSFGYTNGYSLGITPVVDGVAQMESQFNGVGTSIAGQCQIFIGVRGTRIAAQVRVITQLGQIRFFNLQTTYAAIRTWP